MQDILLYPLNIICNKKFLYTDKKKKDFFIVYRIIIFHAVI